jgi:WD40 repeat protein
MRLFVLTHVYLDVAGGHWQIVSPLRATCVHSSIMSPRQLEYQECYRKPAHKSVINAMVFSPDLGRLVTGSEDCTVSVWSTQSGSILCHITAHNPVVSLGWLTNSNGFLLGCKNGMMASVGLSEVRIPSLLSRHLVNRYHSSRLKQYSSGLTMLRSAVYRQSSTTSFRYLQPLRTLRFGRARDRIIWTVLVVCSYTCGYRLLYLFM